METLALYLFDPPGATAPRVAWQTRPDLALASKQGVQVFAAQQQGSGSLDDFVRLYREQWATREVTVIIPGLWLTYTRVVVTIKNQRQMLQALPFMIEEQVIGNIEDMHIATPLRIAGDMIRLAIIERAMLEALRTLFSGNAIILGAVYGVPDLLACGDSEMHILFHGNSVAVKSPTQCFECDSDSLETLLDMVALDGISGVKISVDEGNMSAQELAARLQVKWSAESTVVRVVPYAGDVLSFLLAQAAAGFAGSLDILHGDNSASNSTREVFRKYVPVAWMAVLCLSLQVGFNLASGYYFHRYASRLENNLSARYLALFPEDTRVIDLGAQLKGKLNSTRFQAHSRSFPDVFSTVISVMNRTGNMKDIHLKQFHYDEESGELKMGLDIGSVAMLDRIKQGLLEHNYLVDIVSANEEGGSIKATLSIRHS